MHLSVIVAHLCFNFVILYLHCVFVAACLGQDSPATELHNLSGISAG